MKKVEEKAKASSSSPRGAGCGALIIHSALSLAKKTTHPSKNTALSACFSTQPDLTMCVCVRVLVCVSVSVCKEFLSNFQQFSIKMTGTTNEFCCAI